MDELVVEATDNKLPDVLAFIDAKLEEIGCSMPEQTEIDISVEELFVNIAHYAYHPDIGTATVRISVSNDPLSV